MQAIHWVSSAPGHFVFLFCLPQLMVYHLHMVTKWLLHIHVPSLLPAQKKVMRKVDRIHKRKVNFLINSQWIFFFLILLARTGVNNFPSCKEVRKCIVTVRVWWKSKKSQLSVVNFWKRNMNKQLTVSGTEIKQYSYPKGKQEKLFVLSVQMMGR